MMQTMAERLAVKGDNYIDALQFLSSVKSIDPDCNFVLSGTRSFIIKFSDGSIAEADNTGVKVTNAA